VTLFSQSFTVEDVMCSERLSSELLLAVWEETLEAGRVMENKRNELKSISMTEVCGHGSHLDWLIIGLH
jgi:hypothetical protein